MAAEFPESAETVQATLARVLELQHASTDAQLVRMASLSVTHLYHDSWNGGTDFYQLTLRIPLEVFVQLQPALAEHEESLKAAAGSLWRDLESDVISEVRIAPIRTGPASPPTVEPLAAIPSFWSEGRFRLFISHHSSQKEAVALLQKELSWLGVSAFVAHNDIEPSTLWQREIERSLLSCEALVAVISPEFVSSHWCDQEVGFALGRGLEVIPIAWGATPHGFIGKIQALPITRGKPLSSAAHALVTLLLKSPRTTVSMSNALVTALANAPSFAIAKDLAGLLEHVPTLSAAHAALLRGAKRTHGQVRDAFGVPDRIERILNSHGLRAGAT